MRSDWGQGGRDTSGTWQVLRRSGNGPQGGRRCGLAYGAESARRVSLRGELPYVVFPPQNPPPSSLPQGRQPGPVPTGALRPPFTSDPRLGNGLVRADCVGQGACVPCGPALSVGQLPLSLFRGCSPRAVPHPVKSPHLRLSPGWQRDSLGGRLSPGQPEPAHCSGDISQTESVAPAPCPAASGWGAAGRRKRGSRWDRPRVSGARQPRCSRSCGPSGRERRPESSPAWPPGSGDTLYFLRDNSGLFNGFINKFEKGGVQRKGNGPVSSC